MPDWVLTVERAYVASATGGSPKRGGDPANLPRALAALGAIASHYLAVGTPRTLGIVGDGELSVEAHRTWFAPREIRTLENASLGEVLASDIVCVHSAIEIRAADLRRGTHVNILGPAAIDDELRRLATISEEARDLGALAAGLVDGRQLDELTVFIAGDAQIALGVL